MDTDYPIDLAEVMNILATSDVVIIRFSTVEKRVLLDFRANDVERPLVRLVNRVRSAEERFRELKRLRPGLVLPDQIMTFHWPKHVASLERMGILDRIIEKLVAMGYPETVTTCRQIYQELLDLERAELIAAIKGEGYQALWENKKA